MAEYEDFYNAALKRKSKARDYPHVLDAALDYFAVMDFDLEKMNWETFYQFISTKEMRAIDEYQVAKLVSNILDKDFEHCIMRRPARIIRDETYDRHDFSYDRKFFMTNTEWENYLRTVGERLIHGDGDSVIARNLITDSLAWEYPCKKGIKKITIGDIERTHDGIAVAGSELVGEVYHRCYDLLEDKKKETMLQLAKATGSLRYTDIQFSREIFERSFGRDYMCTHDIETIHYLDRMTVEIYNVQL